MMSSWMHPALRVRRSGIESRGVFTTKRIKADSTVAVFGGVVRTFKQLERLSIYQQEHALQIGDELSLVPLGREPADCFNHSCAPTCGIRGQVELVTRCDVVPGDELTFDYAMTVARRRRSDFIMECQCGSAFCRKIITGHDYKRLSYPDRYLSSYVQSLVNR